LTVTKVVPASIQIAFSTYSDEPAKNDWLSTCFLFTPSDRPGA
jgi:hypothetical protein